MTACAQCLLRQTEQRAQRTSTFQPGRHVGITALTIALCICFSGMVLGQEIGQVSAFERNVLAFLDQHCIECHIDDDAPAGIALDEFRAPADTLGAVKTWLRVLDAVDRGVMPPEDTVPPAADERRRFIEWIENDFFAALSDQKMTSSAAVIRRLNRQEYDNTIRDLIGLDLRLAKDFPPDDTGFGFDNIGSALNISPVHIERYLDAAEAAMQAAIVVPDVEPYPPVELIGLRTYPLPPDGSVEFEHHLAPGRYLADFSLVRAGIDESVPPPRLVIGFGKDRRAVTAARIQDETVVYRYWLRVAEGDDEVHVSLVEPHAETSDAVNADTTAIISGDQRYGNDHGLHVDSMVVRGPVHMTEAELPESHRQILFCTPQFGDASRLECARQAIARFVQRAFRRPVSTEEVEPVMQIFQMAHDRGESFERASQIALAAVLVSPQFLFLVEPEDANEDRPLTDHELASRLSYFLWSTMPDEPLLREAAEGTLRRNLRAQVARMLADRKSQAFIENFVGQWLQLRNLDGVAPDTELFPTYDEDLKHAMRKETELFFAHLVRDNRSVLELLDSGYTFVNAILADHYEIAGVEGNGFRRITLGSGDRGGILTQGSILTLTSNHNRTSPVKRGQWVLQQLLGTPPPPPPPGVSDLDESPQAAQSASLRERLEAHRANPQCAACHSQMDPMGFALENYDAIGRWRTSDGSFAIDASGELLGGHHFEDAKELKALLRSTETRRFSWCLIENMLVYGLGRSLEPQDYHTVEAIRRRLAEDDYRIGQIFLGIVESDAFLRRGVSP